MVQNHEIEKRPRGRPQIRCDDDTRSVIIEAANRQFHENGYAAASIAAIAQEAGVSTKTLYRLFPTKADLFSEMIIERTDRFLMSVDPGTLAVADLRQGLERMLMAYGMLTLSLDTITMTRLVISESDRFPEIANTFYEKAIVRTNRLMEDWLRRQIDRGLIALDDPHAACGMLRGMMIMEPQRAAMLRQEQPPKIDAIAARAKMCADLFLKGCAL
ncbi:TetR/AcrR family transcriptional regulator [Rhizobium binae]|uniref:AcrR family transcriptional regulator n=1 Tax=Rhizobium binae TaxID=1138190 RepID=A0ABV2MJ25_9HYPH|nr:TetR/AcrR family transcriptional regulator [Rhizobium binae]NKL48784.1 TetR family transcriptional regulator [Rhizobium leguminosarum bv. viciae]MBX4925342.1 TetR/AcrR family transcriptional regulator [Rhizobium binae]MBX4936296.1 TetR/AcrR family transcriptional regulator [Rhizobium binae]MBX4942613.1 TetR/AcrR family transcriptional regulator [Rhizobium binae]MBX4950421.1 TetR/AcrR family transcriptional regulator [Rhizobium binae]